MIGLGFAEILILALASGGMNSTDVVAFIPPAHYFKSRQIEVTFDKMIELAGREAKDPKTQIQQLVALRHLADEADKLKKAANYAVLRQTLEKIAQGKQGADSLGFAQEYADRVLRKLDNKKTEVLKTKPIREDALGWFPADVNLAFALDMRPTYQLPSNPIGELLKLMPDDVKKEMYDHLEKAGNMRVERAAFGFTDGGGKAEQMKIFMRFSGKANQAWLIDALKTLDRGRLQMKQIKDDKGAPITLLQDGDRPPVIMMVGNTDLLIFGHQRDQGKHEDMIAEILDARSGKKPNAAAGKLKKQLAKIPDKAIAFGVGEIPNDLKREFRFLFDPAPDNITAFIERTQTGMDVQIETVMATRDDAGKLVQKIADLQKQGIAGLEEAMKQPQPPGFPQIPYQSLINLLQTLQVQSDAEKVQSRVIVPDGLIQQMGSMGMMMFGAARPVPPPKCD